MAPLHPPPGEQGLLPQRLHPLLPPHPRDTLITALALRVMPLAAETALRLVEE